MNNTATALTALQQAGAESTAIQRTHLNLRETGSAAVIRIHSLDTAQITRALQQAEIELPATVGQSEGRDPVIMCIRPGEWLVYSEALQADQLLQQLRELGQTDATAIYDASDALASFRISGAAAPWLLAKLSSLDFVGGSKAGQHCARTRMGQVAVVVNYRQPGGDDSAYVYDLIFDRSIALYLWQLLQHAADHAEELSA
jgi:heterotetrameric sarcosine oxidase gamma subunit